LNILNKGKPKHKHMNPRRQWRKLLTALTVAISMAVAPAAMADMNGYDISNWQCGIDTATVPADFVIVGTTWGSGGVYGGCLSNGVNTDANRQLAGAINSGKETGIYHYARGGNPETEARFFVDNVRGYVHKSVLILDWEAQDNAAWGDKQWPRRWAREVKRLTGVNPIIYTMDSGYWQVAGMETELNCGIWIAQYATNMVTGYQTAPWNIGARGEVMRQYTSNGSLSGWSGRLDLNKFRWRPRGMAQVREPRRQGRGEPAERQADATAHDSSDGRPGRFGHAHHPRRLRQRSRTTTGARIQLCGGHGHRQPATVRQWRHDAIWQCRLVLRRCVQRRHHGRDRQPYRPHAGQRVERA
jgi:Lyzozyme M1 (1,4-beta-N-acetylmuramidase)